MTASHTTLEQYGEIGALLKRAREEIGLSVEEGARSLHIRMRYIDALEQGRLRDLPGLTYTRGYLQAYAALLGLDKEEILRRFESIESALTRKTIYFPQVFSKQKTPEPWMVWGGLGVALVIYLAWLIALQPGYPTLSIVEAAAERPVRNYAISASPKVVACLQLQNPVYPPCIAGQQPVYGLVLLPDRIESVMELSNMHARIVLLAP